MNKQEKIEKVMHEYKRGWLHSGSKTGPVVKDRKQAIAIALSEANANKMATGGGVENKPTQISFREYATYLGIKEDLIEPIYNIYMDRSKSSHTQKIQVSKAIGSENQSRLFKWFEWDGYLPLEIYNPNNRMATGGGIGNAFSSVYNKAKNMSAKKIHDTKKDIALDVIDSTKDKVTGNKYKVTLKGAEQIIEDKYAKGGIVKNLKQNLIDIYNKYGKDSYINTVQDILDIIKETKSLLNYQINDKVTYKNAITGVKMTGEIIDIDEDGKYASIRNKIGNIDYLPVLTLSKI